jgi:hypothetical protein
MLEDRGQKTEDRLQIRIFSSLISVFCYLNLNYQDYFILHFLKVQISVAI